MTREEFDSRLKSSGKKALLFGPYDKDNGEDGEVWIHCESYEQFLTWFKEEKK